MEFKALEILTTFGINLWLGVGLSKVRPMIAITIAPVISWRIVITMSMPAMISEVALIPEDCLH